MIPNTIVTCARKVIVYSFGITITKKRPSAITGSKNLRCVVPVKTSVLVQVQNKAGPLYATSTKNSERKSRRVIVNPKAGIFTDVGKNWWNIRLGTSKKTSLFGNFLFAVGRGLKQKHPLWRPVLI